MANQPEPLLQKLVDLALEVCSAGSAGVSLLDKSETGEEFFRWVALAGLLPRIPAAQPCPLESMWYMPEARPADALSYPARYFTYFEDVPLTLVEGLVVPLRANGNADGTIWVMQHTGLTSFDAEDPRILESLGALTAAAIRLQETGKKQSTRDGERKPQRCKRRHTSERSMGTRSVFRATFAKAAIGMAFADLKAASCR